MYQVSVWTNSKIIGTDTRDTLDAAVARSHGLRQTFPHADTVEVTDPRNAKGDDSVRCYYSA